MILLTILYSIFILLVCIKILYDTDTPSKVVAYLFLIIFFPVIGVIFYLTLGVNYRKQKLYKKSFLVILKSFMKLKKK
ncbi:PLDc N-terminal domain-containing protein [Tenacibaculum tangerinum]|uniref:PLDc N-terminal domain-containing protein n=1 Tax=Tenacibaculum tangerinum TaxID=3038772 RepID=A0ABY8L4T8_9FLAO|nr:PLDc N-terminal domain-containing protein [Tenacibaculum tangerinum]WGH75044.1 PLDc N-terminal domain-containing protein [Tenacibaculum tangerinum]